jgi:PAS domain S-box-containing protein
VNRTVVGLNKDQVIGASALDFVKDEQKSFAKSVYDQVIRTGKPMLYDVQWLGPDGITAWYSTHAGPIYDKGNLIGVGGSSIDVTKQKEEEFALERKFSELVEAVQGIFWEVDPSSQKFVFVSKQAECILGYPPEQWTDYDS